MSHDQTRIYNRADSVVFFKTNELFGGLSNMAGGFPLHVNGIRIRTSEALYQACRFPHLPQVQRLIIGQKSPMTAKMKSKPCRQNSRPDWYQVRVKIMRWCLRIKLTQNWGAFSKLLLETGHRPIVEQSWKDDFWGASPVDKHTLIGMNVLGRLLMELREAVKIEERRSFLRVEPLGIRDFQLDGRPIETVAVPNDETGVEGAYPVEHPSYADIGRPMAIQHALFDSQVAKDAPLPGYTGEKSKSAGLSNIKFYPDMKNSGVEWLGDVPAHWKKLPGRACFSEKKIPNTGMKETTVLSLSYGQIVVKPVEKLHGLVPASFETYQVIEPGDIVVRPTDLQNDWNSLRFGLNRHRGIITSAYMCLNSDGVMSRDYGYLLLHTYDLKKVFYGLGSGLRQNLNWSDFKYLPCLVPPLPEQHRIATFLDQKTAEIDEAISKKQRLIELLKEQKAILINQAVTKGLNPNVPMRDSGVEWIGEVPAHWEVKRIKYFSSVQGGITLGRSYSGNNLESYPYLRVANVQDGYFDLDEITELSLPKREAEHYFVKAGDILVTEGGDIDKLGRGAVWEGQIENCLHQNHIFAVRISRRAATAYFVALAMACNYGRRYFTTTANKTTNLASTNRTKLGNFPIALPPLDEQKELVNHSKRMGREYEKVIEIVSKELERLNEFRCSLIASAVTGKIKV